MPTFENPLKDEPRKAKVGKGRVHVYEQYAHLCEKTQVVDVNERGHLIATNTQLAAIKALVCSQPEIEKFSKREGAHALAGMNLEQGIGLYELKEHERRLKEIQGIHSNAKFDSDRINDLPTQGTVFSEAQLNQLEFVNFKECEECEGLAMQLGEAFLVQKMQELGIKAFGEKLPELAVQMNKAAKEHPLYLECVERNNHRDSTLKALTKTVIPKMPVTATEGKDRYKQLAVEHYYRLETNDQLTGFEGNYDKIVEKLSNSKERAYNECPACNTYLYLVVQFKQACEVGQMPPAIKALHDKAKAGLYDKRGENNSSHGAWRTPDLTATLTSAEWDALPQEAKEKLEDYLVTFAWFESPIYEDFTFANGEVQKLSAYEICRMHNCRPSCEACNEFWDATNPRKPEYVACYVQNCLDYTCEICPECLPIARDFGADSDAYRDCYRQNKFDPCGVCRDTLEQFGRNSVQYATCVEKNCEPIGPHSQAQWEVSKTSTAYPLSIIKDMLDGTELCIECCLIDRKAEPQRYLECVAQHCLNNIPDFLCYEGKMDLEFIESLPKPQTEENFHKDPLDSINQIPFMDARLIAKVQHMSNVRIISANKLVVVDGVSYYEDKLELLDSGKVITKRTRIFTPDEAIDALGMDYLASMTDEEADEKVRAYIRDTQDLTFLLKNPGEAEQEVSNVQFDSRCATLKQALKEQPWPEPVELDGCTLQGNCLVCETATFIKRLCKYGNCYVLKVFNKITQEEKIIQSCEEPHGLWDEERINCYKILSRIPPSAIEQLVSVDEAIKSLLRNLGIPKEEHLNWVKKNVVCKFPNLADYLQENPDGVASSDLMQPIVRSFEVGPEITEEKPTIAQEVKIRGITLNQTPHVEQHIALPASDHLMIETSPDLLREVVEETEEMRKKTLDHLQHLVSTADLIDGSYLNKVKVKIWIPHKEEAGYKVDANTFNLTPLLDPLKVLDSDQKIEPAPHSHVWEKDSSFHQEKTQSDMEAHVKDMPERDKRATDVKTGAPQGVRPSNTVDALTVAKIKSQITKHYALPESVKVEVGLRQDSRNQVVVAVSLDLSDLIAYAKDNPAAGITLEELRRLETLQSIALHEVRYDMLYTKRDDVNNITIIYQGR